MPTSKIKSDIRRSDFYLIPNILTLSRVFAVPLVALFSYWNWDISSAIVFAAAGISDYIDGWIARRYGYESKLGILLDPLADKLIIVSTMIMLLWLGRLSIPFQFSEQISEHWLKLVPPALVIVTVGREIAITGLRAIASSIGMVMPADRGGKIKTWIQFFAILFILINRDPWHVIGLVFLFISVFAALWSGISYTYKFVRKLPR